MLVSVAVGVLVAVSVAVGVAVGVFVLVAVGVGVADGGTEPNSYAPMSTVPPMMREPPARSVVTPEGMSALSPASIAELPACGRRFVSSSGSPVMLFVLVPLTFDSELWIRLWLAWRT